MKKPVIILIAVIYLFAILVVGFLGIPARVYNPKVYVTDITLSFDDKLGRWDPTGDVEFNYYLRTDKEANFSIVGKVLPLEATEKKCVFEKLDNFDFYTYSIDFNEKSGATIASFTVAPIDYGEAKTLRLRVRPNDGNKTITKLIEITIINL